MTRSVGALLGALWCLTMVAPAAWAEDPTIIISLKDHQFTPSEVTAPAGQKLKIVVRNQGATSSEFESSDFHREKIVLPNSEITVYVGPLDAGTYEFFDDFHQDTRGHLHIK
jgi:plastocyanin